MIEWVSFEIATPEEGRKVLMCGPKVNPYDYDNDGNPLYSYATCIYDGKPTTRLANVTHWVYLTAPEIPTKTVRDRMEQEVGKGIVSHVIKKLKQSKGKVCCDMDELIEELERR